MINQSSYLRIARNLSFMEAPKTHLTLPATMKEPSIPKLVQEEYTDL